MGGEREAVQSYLLGVIDEQAARRHRRDEIYRQNGRLLDEGILLFGKSLRFLIEHGEQTRRGRATPPTPIELDGQPQIFVSLSESFAPDYNTIGEGVEISLARDGERTTLFKITPWGRVENTHGQQASPEELEIAKKILDLLQKS